LLITSFCYSQTNNIAPTINDALTQWGFLEGKVIDNQDTVTYYLKNYNSKPSNLVVFIQGTDANPLFSYRIKDGEPIISRWFGDEYKLLDSTYTYAIIPKPGMAGLFKNKFSVPKEYYQNNYLGYRVHQIDFAINDIIKKHLQNPKKIIVYGHSEGATIAAPLTLKNKSITHIGFWSGNVLNNFYEFSLFTRIEALKGQMDDSTAHANVMGIIDWYKSVINNPNSTELDHFGFTNKRWSSYEKPPIDYLLQLDIPIYAVFATKDESTPIETAYLLPIQFLAHRKNNLTFEVCIDCNHMYLQEKNGQQVSNWNTIFTEFINWTN